MKRVRRVLSLLLCTVMLAAALVMPAAPAPLYFTSLNDSLEQLTAETMPVWFGGALYVPLSLFSPTTNTTRVDLGLNVSYSASSNTATLFNLRKILVFDLNEGTCYSDLTGEEFAAQAISRGGRVYVPVAVVCEFFGFSWSYNVLPTVDQGYLVRVKNEDVALDDARFIDAATELIGRRLRDYNQRMNPKPTTPVTPDPEPVQPDDSPEEKPAAAVYLGFRCVSGEELTAVLDLMDRAGKLGVFFLTPEQIHSGWVGGLKETKYRTLMQTKPELAVKVAVRGMMPRNVITKDSLTRLHIYRGGEHQHAAQKPELWAAE